MKAVHWLVIALAVAGCTDRALMSAPESGPPTAPQASIIRDLLGGTGLLQCSNLSYATATQTIGSKGGTIRVGPHTLTVPAGALSSPVAITAVVVTGLGINVVHFQPEGLRFKRSASLTMSYANCDVLGRLLPKRIAYVDDGLGILSYLLSIDNLLGKQVTGRVDHFSNYAVAW